MSSTMMMERTGMAVPGLGVPGLGTPTVGTPAGAPVGANWLMVPRCNLKVEKCSGGIKLTAQCDDKVAASMVQNLCQMLAGGVSSVCATYNGLPVCTCNLTMGLCKCDVTDSGVCMTCTSGDPECCKMIQSCGEALASCLEAGCTGCLLINSTPVCCGYSETSKHSPKTKAGR